MSQLQSLDWHHIVFLSFILVGCVAAGVMVVCWIWDYIDKGRGKR